MKKKLLNYLLIGAITFIWGVIVYRIVYALKDSDENITSQPVIQLTKEPLDNYDHLKDTARLALNYPDPFNESHPKDTLEIPIRTLMNKPLVVRNITVAATPVNWNFISYGGYIKNASSKKVLAMVTINGQEFMLSEGETAAQVKLLKNFRDSIKISYQGKTKYLTLNNK